ncbi:MAG: aldehyde ferredoxin oxidoreductase, partial [Proteobacteria bacterium]|nr:aldehyde ferredoxin oxidoreductase [Pseudomonadota bacterium]
MAWQGKVLRVNLTTGKCTSEPLNRDWAQAYLGQRGLASRYLAAEVDPKVDPLAPANKLILATGPLTGTMASTGGRYSAVTKGALTDAIACSNAGGYFGAELKMAGWDMVILEGRSRKPVYLLILDDKAELLSAEGFIWGCSAWETEDRIRARHQDPGIRTAVIGVAGEVGVRFACIMNDRDRAAGRSGVGAVMGSKRLKAVAVRGSLGVNVAQPKAFMKTVAAARRKLDPHPSRARLAA